jgi:hypothetical protein
MFRAFHDQQQHHLEQCGRDRFGFQHAAAHSRFANDIGLVGSSAAADQMSASNTSTRNSRRADSVLRNWHGYSPLVDAGVMRRRLANSAVDLVGRRGILGAHVDIGAYENEVIFVDGFEP